MTTSRWHRAWKAEGRRGLKAAGRAGRKPRLDAPQFAALDTALRRGAHALGLGCQPIQFELKLQDFLETAMMTVH